MVYPKIMLVDERLVVRKTCYRIAFASGLIMRFHNTLSFVRSNRDSVIIFLLQKYPTAFWSVYIFQ